ncbi:hypothetical protein DW877_16710 [[Clostridium] symbiosum]|nr:hypothetical protein DW877_16710 [[Clostridium] symbiosum]
MKGLVKQVRTPPVRPADGVVGCVYESFVPGEDCCGLGLRPLIVSRVKCGGGPCRGHSALLCVGNTICLPCAFLKNCRKIDISLPETRSGRDRALLI